mgnify:FL=1
MSPERRKALKRGSGCRSQCDVARYGIAGQLSEMQADSCAKKCAFEVGLQCIGGEVERAGESIDSSGVG